MKIVPASFYDRKIRPDVLTQSMTFCGLSVSRNLFSKAKMRQFGASGNEGFMVRVMFRVRFKVKL